MNHNFPWLTWNSRTFPGLFFFKIPWLEKVVSFFPGFPCFPVLVGTLYPVTIHQGAQWYLPWGVMCCQPSVGRQAVLTLRGSVLSPFTREPSCVYLEGWCAVSLHLRAQNFVFTLRGGVLSPFSRSPVVFTLSGSMPSPFSRSPVVFTLRGGVLSPFSRSPVVFTLRGGVLSPFSRSPVVLTLSGGMLSTFSREAGGTHLEGWCAVSLHWSPVVFTSRGSVLSPFRRSLVVFTLRGSVLSPFTREPSGVYLEG